jgi:hypothetical protein
MTLANEVTVKINKFNEGWPDERKYGYKPDYMNMEGSVFRHPKGHALTIYQNGTWYHTSGKGKSNKGTGPESLTAHLKKFHQAFPYNQGNT